MKTIGLDIGGTTIKGAVLLNDNIIKEVITPTNSSKGKEEVISNIFKVISELLPFADTESKIGIASAGDIDSIKGEIVYSTGNLPDFTGLKLKALVEEKFHRPTTVVNDAISALIGELYFGVAKGYKNVVMLTLGTGLGGGIVVDGKILLGKNFRGARLGHTILHSSYGRQCNCGRIGCAEQYVSATGIIKTASEVGLKIKNANEFFALYEAKKPEAVRGMALFVDDLCLLTTNIVSIFDPEMIVFGGGIAEIKDKWWYNFLNCFNNENGTKLVTATLGNKAGFIGSCYAVNNEDFFTK